jgi:uncharacterized peroxidase-related enzyme
VPDHLLRNQTKEFPMSAEYKTKLPPVTEASANPDQAKILAKAKAAVGFIPNMYAGMVNSPGLLETYLDGYARFRQSGRFTPQEQETVFLVLSRENGCTYCVTAHSMLAAKKSGVPENVLNAIRSGGEIPDRKLAALARFTAHMHDTRGRPTKAEVAAFKAAGYGDEHIYEIILAQAVKTLSNYANHIQHTKVDDMFASFALEPEHA